MKVGFNVKYGYNEIEIPVNEGKLSYDNASSGLSDLNGQTFTLINQIPQGQGISTKVAWKKHILSDCGKRDGVYDRSSGTMAYKDNTWTVYIQEWQRFKQPKFLKGGYYALSDNEKEGFFTANVGDLLIFSEIEDAAPTTLQEFIALRDKYKDVGGIITAVEVYIKHKNDGTAWKTNHIELIKG